MPGRIHRHRRALRARALVRSDRARAPGRRSQEGRGKTQNRVGIVSRPAMERPAAAVALLGDRVRKARPRRDRVRLIQRLGRVRRRGRLIRCHPWIQVRPGGLQPQRQPHRQALRCPPTITAPGQRRTQRWTGVKGNGEYQPHHLRERKRTGGKWVTASALGDCKGPGSIASTVDVETHGIAPTTYLRK